MKELSPIKTFAGQGEIKVVVFPFATELEAGETLNGATVQSVLASGEDSTPAQVLVGLPQVVGTDVLQRVQGRVPGAVYRLVAVASGNTGLRHMMSALLPCADA
jgi:hypothetical protein